MTFFINFVKIRHRMEHSLLDVLEQLQNRISEMQEEMRELRHRNSRLEEENAELREKEALALKKRDEALVDVEYLSVSRRLAESPDTLVETRRMIAGLIRNIDRCIQMLKE